LFNKTLYSYNFYETRREEGRGERERAGRGRGRGSGNEEKGDGEALFHPHLIK
jgi:hypothetical protein